VEDPVEAAERGRDRELEPGSLRRNAAPQRPLGYVGRDWWAVRIREQEQVDVVAHGRDHGTRRASDTAERMLLETASVEGNPKHGVLSSR
jgi:hypothetical protein